MLVDWLGGTKNLFNKLNVACFSTYLLQLQGTESITSDVFMHV